MFGLERAALFPIAGAWTVAAMVVTFLHMQMHLAWVPALFLTAGPASTLTACCLFLIQGKPSGYLMDWVEEIILRQGEEEFPRRGKVSPPYPNAPRQGT